MIKRVIVLFVGMTIFLSSCDLSSKNNENANEHLQIDPFDAAVPHGATLPSEELSKEDKSKLAKAKGKEAKLLKPADLIEQINNSTGKLMVFCFWKLENSACQQNVKDLHQLQAELKGSFDITLINLDGKEKIDSVNAFIRENNVINQTYILSAKSKSSDWTRRISKAWAKEVPALLMINNSNGTNAFYQRIFTYDEMNALIQPYAL